MPARPSRPAGWWLVGILLLALGCRSRPAEAELTSAKDRTPQVQSLLADAARAYQRGNLLLTQQLLLKAGAAAPDDPDIALDLGDTLNRLQHMESARQHYVEFLSRHPSASQVRLALGLTLMGLGRWEEAVNHIRRVTRELPQDQNARFNLGIVLARLGRTPEALAELRRAAKSSPPDPALLTELGITLMRAGEPAEAAKTLEQALSLDPDNVPALFNLGQCYGRLGRVDEAREALERFSLASGRRERYIDEKRLFRAAQARSDSLARVGKDEQALGALLAYRDSLADFPLFQQELGVAYLRAGRRQEAIAAFERAVAKDSSLTESHAQLAGLYQQAGEGDKAMRARQAAARPSSQGPLPSDTP
ncbi:MAG: tetratricopeptide repeat protein [Acidobacteria bacterium]|nr:tetratricopeptide repeat protein [Acidobacteriota bacterium]MCI0568722.1 tetratricopeptide repeat protein [Acidobacteriota bacterium]